MSVHGMAWREEKELGKDVIMLSQKLKKWF